MIITDEILARRLVFQHSQGSNWKNMKKLSPVDDDYLLENYFYAVFWRASWIKRVLRDYDYLDYSVLGWWLQTILSGMRSTGGGKSNRKA